MNSTALNTTGSIVANGTTNKAERKPLHKKMRSYLSRYRVDVWRLTCGSPANHGLTVIYAGREINKEYLKNAIFDGDCLEDHLGRRWIFELNRMVDAKASILVTEYGTDRKSAATEKNGFMIPFWLGWFVDISEEIKKIVKSNSSLESDVRRIRKNKLSYAINDDPQAYETFYDTMYLPYIQKNYKNTALLMNRWEMLRERDRCQLLYVQKEQVDIGGILIKFEPDYPRLWSIGVKRASDEYLIDGVIGALYYFPIKHLKEIGYDRVHFGGTRSFLNDGVLNYKKKWPLQNAGFTKEGFQFQLVSNSPATINLLQSRPFIFVENQKLYSAVFISAGEPMSSEDFKRLYKSYYLPGLNKLVLYVFGNEKNAVEQGIPTDYKDLFVVRAAGDLFA